jgi:hypothetical protein
MMSVSFFSHDANVKAAQFPGDNLSANGGPIPAEYASRAVRFRKAVPGSGQVIVRWSRQLIGFI